MCGITGFLDSGGRFSTNSHLHHVTQMATMIASRGPDDEGFWVEPSAGLALGFRRLAIIDLSAEGAQPMHSHDGRFSIVYYGEIYFATCRHEGAGGQGEMIAPACPWPNIPLVIGTGHIPCGPS